MTQVAHYKILREGVPSQSSLAILCTRHAEELEANGDIAIHVKDTSDRCPVCVFNEKFGSKKKGK